MMARTKGTKTIVTMSLDTELVRRLDDLADAQGRSRSWVIENWMREKLEDEEVTVKLLTNPVVMKAVLETFKNPEVLRTLAKMAMGSAGEQDVLKFRQGMQLLGNYTEEWQKSLPPELVAEKAMKRTIAQNKSAKKRTKKEKH